MKAYKFKGPAQIPHALDIIFNHRIYCADWATLNDPMEGVFFSSGKQNNAAVMSEIQRELRTFKVCSLAESYDSHLLWSHYASGFSGLAIEVELPDSAPGIRKVTYDRGVFAAVQVDGPVDTRKAAEDILFSKHHVWNYEGEIRVLHTDAYFGVTVSGVIVGNRMEPALFDAMHLICRTQGIPFYRVGIGDEGLDMDAVSPLFAHAVQSSKKSK